MEDMKDGTCMRCHEEYSEIFETSVDLWKRITGIQDGSGHLCIPCVDAMAREKGIYLFWVPIEINERTKGHIL